MIKTTRPVLCNAYAVIFARCMKRSQRPYPLKNILSSVFMMLALAWLTVCLPYVNEQQQQLKGCIEKTAGNTADDNSNPLGNTNEEKTESGTSLLAEYLHEMHELAHNFITLTTFYKCHPSDLYLAYHPELVIPPPEA